MELFKKIYCKFSWRRKITFKTLSSPPSRIFQLFVKHPHVKHVGINSNISPQNLRFCYCLFPTFWGLKVVSLLASWVSLKLLPPLIRVLGISFLYYPKSWSSYLFNISWFISSFYSYWSCPGLSACWGPYSMNHYHKQFIIPFKPSNSSRVIPIL